MSGKRIQFPGRVPDLGKVEENVPTALEIVAHQSAVYAGHIGNRPCLTFDLQIPGTDVPMAIRLTVPFTSIKAMRDVGEGCIAKADELEGKGDDGSPHHQDA